MRRGVSAWAYKNEISNNVQSIINEAEEEEKFERLFIYDEEIRVEYNSWIGVLGNTRAQTSLF